MTRKFLVIMIAIFALVATVFVAGAWAQTPEAAEAPAVPSQVEVKALGDKPINLLPKTTWENGVLKVTLTMKEGDQVLSKTINLDMRQVLPPFFNDPKVKIAGLVVAFLIAFLIVRRLFRTARRILSFLFLHSKPHTG
jgi:hypothetical protein